jgi:uncharacterized metal-binding protein
MTITSSESNKEITRMKKLLAFAIGLGLVLGTVSFSFAQDTSSTMKKSKKKKKSDTSSTSKM